MRDGALSEELCSSVRRQEKSCSMNTTDHGKDDHWNDHWTNYATSAALNPAQAYRRKLVFETLALRDAKKAVRLLDLGSGAGDFAREVLEERPDAEVLGLDFSASGVELCRRRVPGAEFVQQDFTKPMALDDRYRGWATHAVCSEVLEHLDDPEAMLKNVRPLFAPGCQLVVTVPAGPMSAFDRSIGHRRHFSPALLEQTLRQAGLEIADLRGAGFPFFNAYRLVVIARGKKLIDDVADKGGAKLPLSARAAMRAFSWLFRFNIGKTKLGWQLVALGAEPE
jgi:2-polyprenyl-3-methyl-5-hydroxy-6-metoxy-1,4-benzoquinol methylase